MSDAIPFVFRKFSMLVDGTIRMIVDVEPMDAQGVFKLFNEPNVGGAMVRLNVPGSGVSATHGSAIGSWDDAEAVVLPAKYGEQARQLKLSGFFRCQSVWRCVGPDAKFLEWVRRQKCSVCKADAPSEAAHVRRVASGAGTSTKPQYSAIPLCNKHHRLQHDKGESAIGGKEFCDRERIKALEQWCWETVKEQIGFAHWNEVPPSALYTWALDHGVTELLPEDYLVAPGGDEGAQCSGQT